MRIHYRVRQFLTALSSSEKGVDRAASEAYLSAAQVALFRRMPAAEQRHALAMLRTLQKEGHDEAALMQAVLLHDVGKIEGPVRLWHRVATVLLQALAPALLHRLAVNERGSWRYPFFVQLHHAAQGADMAAGAGTDPLAVALIHWHHTTPQESDLDTRGQELLTALQSADEKN